MWDGHLGRINIAKHRIELEPKSNPVHLAPYRAGPTVREFQVHEIEKMLSKKVNEPAQTEWVAPIVFAPMKDRSLRFWLHYRKLNNLTRRNPYPIPRMDQCIDSLGEATVFSTLNANSGYWQVEIEEHYRNKTPFPSHHNLCSFVRMPFGLKNAPGTFQQTMDVIVACVNWQFALVYLEDIVIFLKTPEERIEHVRQVLTLC